MNPAGTRSRTARCRHDELDLNVLGGWQIPLRDVAVTVHAVPPPSRASCHTGPRGATTPCTARRGRRDRPRSCTRTLRPGRASSRSLRQFPAGTFDTAQPILQERWSPAAPSRSPPARDRRGRWSASARSGWWSRASAPRPRRAYLGLPPGWRRRPGRRPRPGLARAAPIAVQFSPSARFPAGPARHARRRARRRAGRDRHAHRPRGPRLPAHRADGATGRGRPDRDWRLVPYRTSRDGDLVAVRAPAALRAVRRTARRGCSRTLRATFASSMARVQAPLYEDVTDARLVPRQPTVRPRTVGLRRRSRWIRGRGRDHGCCWRSGPRGRWSGCRCVLSGRRRARPRAAPARTADGTAVLTQTVGSATTSRPPRPTSSASRRAKTCSAGTCRTRSPSG